MSRKIEWLEQPGFVPETWSPVVGCFPIAAGCANCWAARFASRGMCEEHRGLTKGGKWTGTVRCLPDRLDQPLHWKKPRAVAVVLMGDLFHQDVPFRFIADVLNVAFRCHYDGLGHRFLVLTKRPDRMAEFFAKAGTVRTIYGSLPIERNEECPTLPPNIWLGYSASTQEDLERGVPHLMKCPAKVRFLSLEPLLESLDLRFIDSMIIDHREPAFWGKGYSRVGKRPNMIDWAIVGGESGSGARACKLVDIRHAIRQCQAAGVPVFVKQLGSRILVPNDTFDQWPRGGDGLLTDPRCRPHHQGEECQVRTQDPKGGDMAEWPEDLRVRQFPV